MHRFGMDNYAKKKTFYFNTWYLYKLYFRVTWMISSDTLRRSTKSHALYKVVEELTTGGYRKMLLELIGIST